MFLTDELMFRISKEKIVVELLEQPEFSDLGVKEPKNLQECIYHHPKLARKINRMKWNQQYTV